MDIHRIAVESGGCTCRLSYADWGVAGGEPAVVCVHGLTRNCRDFDEFAEALAADRRVICPDMAGRGGSDHLDDPDQYAVPTYADHMVQLIDRLGLGPVDWVGTSMGGLIGIAVAAHHPDRIRRLVLNDIGPQIPAEAIERIRQYLRLDLKFASLVELEAHLRVIHATFGPLTDEQWRHLAHHSALALDDGSWGLHYDHRIGARFERMTAQDLDLWSMWDAIRCPVLVLRGTESDILTAEIAERMQQRGPRTEVVAFEGIGHAPALMAADQIEAVRSWLRA